MTRCLGCSGAASRKVARGQPGRSIEEIGAAANAIADRQGLGAVSMKCVAEAVGFTTMSLYRYVDSKEELQAVMLDVAYGPPALDWRPGLACPDLTVGQADC